MDWSNSTEILNLLDPAKVVNEVGVWLIITVIGFFFWVIWWAIKPIIKKREQERDEGLIYEWLLNKTNLELTVGMPNDPRWRSTEEIADSTNLTDERVRTLCKSNKKIQKMRKEDVWPEKGLGEGGKKEIKPLEEKWAIKEFVKRSEK